jgi:hypothetical protein
MYATVLRLWCAASYRNSGKSWLDHESFTDRSLWSDTLQGRMYFQRKIGLSDTIFMHTKISKMRPDASRWSIVHEFKMKKINYVP